MAIVKQLDKRSGITYLYESTSRWDKAKRQSRATRRLIGRLDPATTILSNVPSDALGTVSACSGPMARRHAPTCCR